MHNILAILYVLLIAGCAASMEQQLTVFDDIPVCCKSFNEIDFKIMPLNEYVKFSLDEGAEVYQFEEEKSYFAAMVIPPGQDFFVLKSHFTSGYGCHYFQPIILTLDGDHNVIQNFSINMSMRSGSFTKKSYMAGSFRLKENTNAKYLLIHTSGDLSKIWDSTFSHTKTTATFDTFMHATYGNIFSHEGTIITLTGSRFGVIEVKVAADVTN